MGLDLGAPFTDELEPGARQHGSTSKPINLSNIEVSRHIGLSSYLGVSLKSFKFNWRLHLNVLFSSFSVFSDLKTLQSKISQQKLTDHATTQDRAYYLPVL